MTDSVFPLQLNYSGKSEALSRDVSPYDVPNQKVSVICEGGDYTFIRNTLPITAECPKIPSATFLAREDRIRAKEEYTRAIHTVQTRNRDTYKDQFTYDSWLSKTDKPTRGVCSLHPVARVTSVPVLSTALVQED